MKKDDFIDSLGKIDEDIIESVNLTRKKRKKQKNRWIRITAVAAAICLIFTGMFYGIGGNGLSKRWDKNDSPLIRAYAVESAVYPQMTQYPKLVNDMKFSLYEDQYDSWSEEARERLNLPDDYMDSLEKFIEESLPTLFECSNKDNKVVSPVNVYIALSVLAEVTEGESRKQILNLLGVESIENLNKKVNSLWNTCYRDDGVSKSVMANSLWLDNTIDYNKDTLRKIADYYFASTFSGEMGSEDYNKSFQKWLSEQTSGLLDEYVSNEEFNSETVFAIASTMLFSAKWDNEFRKSENTESVFHGAQGDKETVFMNEETKGLYYYCDGFSAIQKYFTTYNGSMWFILPDEDTDISSLMKNDKLNKLISGIDSTDSAFININFSVPKFDIDSKTDLSESLQKLGVTDVFDSEKSDFSPIMNSKGAFLSSASHSARITIDEEGCQAAAFTKLATSGDAMPPEEEVDFVLDRPFIVLIQSQGKLPLFIGVVNNV